MSYYKNDDLINTIEKEIGYSEKSDGSTKFGDWYAKKNDGDSTFETAPWCDMFIAWAADKAGVTESVGQFAYTVDHAKWFKKQDAWTTKPAPGAVVFFDYDASGEIDEIDHVGVVEKVRDDQVHTIEANVDGGNLKRKVREEDIIVGYGRPDKVAAKREAKEAKAERSERSDDAKPVAGAGQGPTAMTGVNTAGFVPPGGTMADPQQVVFSGLLVLLLAIIYVTGTLAKARVPALVAQARTVPALVARSWAPALAAALARAPALVAQKVGTGAAAPSWTRTRGRHHRR